jgi:hypothetical protein
MTPEKTGEKQAGRFPKGQSGNPGGRPKGSRNATTLALETCSMVKRPPSLRRRSIWH